MGIPFSVVAAISGMINVKVMFLDKIDYAQEKRKNSCLFCYVAQLSYLCIR